MMNQLCKDLKLIFSLIGENQDMFAGISSPYIQTEHYRKGEIVIEGFQPLSHIYILLSGDVYILNYTFNGKRVISNTLEAPQLLGLIEGINHEDHYMATVVTLTKCTLLKVETGPFLQAVTSNFELSNYIVSYLAKLTTFLMENTSIKMSLSNFDKLLLYLYDQSIGQQPPVIIAENKNFIADLLNINIRTLYRYLDELTELKMIQRAGQNIVMERENIKAIARKVENII